MIKTVAKYFGLLLIAISAILMYIFIRFTIPVIVQDKSTSIISMSTTLIITVGIIVGIFFIGYKLNKID